MRATISTPEEQGRTPRAANLRTALVLVSIALVFFAGIIASQYSGGNAVGIGVLGIAIIGFLLVTVGRKLSAKARGK